MKEPYLIYEKEVALFAEIFPATAIAVRSRPHPQAPERPEFCHVFEQSIAVAQQEAAHTATLATLDDLGTMLNSRIAKMEIICSRSKTPLREGILMAYREIEGWEIQKRKSLRIAGDEQQ